MKIISIALLLFSSPAWACINQLPESEVIKAVALVPGAGAFTCAQKPAEPCVCFDGVASWDVMTYSNGSLSVDPAKAAVKAQADAAAETDRLDRFAKFQARRAPLKQCVQDLKGAATAAQVKSCLLLLLKDALANELSTADL